jgi:hypothetical protein
MLGWLLCSKFYRCKIPVSGDKIPTVERNVADTFTINYAMQPGSILYVAFARGGSPEPEFVNV